MSNSRFLRFVCPLALCFVWTATVATPTSRGAEADKPVFRAGAATANITPPLGELIVGGWDPKPAQYIHDELHARCLVLDDSTNKLAIVLCDNVGIPRDVFDAAKEIVHKETGLPKSNLLMAATHTHSATTARNRNRLEPSETFTDYQKFLIRRIADGVRCALNNLEPAEIGWGSANEPGEVFNRRWILKPEATDALRNPFGGIDKVRMNPPRAAEYLVEPAGPTDPEISFISVRSKTGRPIALLANYSLHYVGGVPTGHVSADYFGVFAERIQKLLGAEDLDPPFVGILSNGTSGDVNNINFTQKAERHAPYEKMRQVADLVADRVYRAHQQIAFQSWVPVASLEEPLTLKTRQPTEEQLELSRKVLSSDNPEKTFHLRERIYAERVRMQQQAPEDVTILLQAHRIGGLCVFAIPFEVFTETGLALKQKCPLDDAFTIELANGSYGYLPTPRQHDLGGYETWLGTNLVEKQASEKIADTLLRLAAKLKEGE